MAFQGLSALIRQIERQYQSPAQQQWRQLQQIWPQVVGDRIAPQTRLVNQQSQVLQVAVAHPMLAQTLMFERPKLLKQLNAHLANPESHILDIRFSTAGWHQPLPTGSPYAASHDFKQHPCQLHPADAAITPPSTPPSSLPRPSDPHQAFVRWATRIRDRDQFLPSCPACGVAAPTGELDRWGSCAICFAQTAFRPHPDSEGSAETWQNH
jgi:predicted nucleic acid-binding Zn ribbon protein